jgi:lysine 2,3-aminomutase
MVNTTFPSKRAPLYADIPDDKWNNWRWQLSNRINTVEEFEKVVPLTQSERKALSAPNLFRVDITPYFISLIDPQDPVDPIRKQVVPTDAEMVPFTP